MVKELQVAPGPAIKQMLDKVLVWQLENPEKTRDDSLAHFKALTQ